jgi:hypothetical protein
MKKRSIILAVMVGMVVSVWGNTLLRAADADAQAYLSYFPAHTNTLMVMQVDDLKKSAKAKEAGWSDKDSSLWIAGTDPLPSWVKLIVRGSHSHLRQSTREWSMSVAPVPEYVGFSTMARTAGQKTQTVAGRPSYLSPKGVYVTSLTRETIGVMRPADRADLARWITQVESGTAPVISEYLQAATIHQGQIVVAMDLAESLDKWMLRQWLESTETLKGSTTRVVEVSDFLETLSGLTLVVNVSDQISAELQIDFQSELPPIADKLHPLLLEYLTHSGAFVEDLEKAKVTLKNQSVVLSMNPLSDSGFQRLMSLILSPHPQHSGTATDSPKGDAPNDAPVSQNGPNVKATQKYYDAIESMLGDLERSYKASRNYNATVVWHERFAQKIDHLPIEGVDPAMIQYGRDTSARLVALAASLQGQPLEIGALNNSITYNVQPEYGGGGWWGAPTVTTSGPVATGYKVDSNLAKVREEQAQIVIAGTKDRQQVWQIQIDERNEIRDAMYQKYEVDFGIDANPQKK